MKIIKRIVIVFVLVGVALAIWSKWYYRTSTPEDPDGVGTVIETFQVSNTVEDRLYQNGGKFAFATMDTSLDKMTYSVVYPGLFIYNAQEHFFYGSTPIERTTYWLERLYLKSWADDHQKLKVSEGMTRFPIAGTSIYPEIKRLKINGVPVDEVREFVDLDGKTWYLWYYKNLELRQEGNQVSFD